MRDAAVDAAHDLIRARGYTPAQLTTLLNKSFADNDGAAPKHVELVEAVRDRIEAKGYALSELATKMPSVRRDFVKRFMSGRELVSLDRSISIAEAVGLKARIVWEVDESIAPRRRTDTPRAVYERCRPDPVSPPPTHQRRGIYRARRAVHSLKAKVLNGWAEGLSRQACADRCGIELGYVDRIISVARQQGDPRAHRRRAPNANSNVPAAERGLSVADAGRPLSDTASSG
ncbi:MULTISPECIES: hypothetical protein [unclassified Methylobacterium]|uniref:hypothetical protein n=1 Tax=unclassified Methylobacterium TaxID=2615210 RepID=UPI00226A7CCB|nr:MULTISPECIES: hypothetical protein [unclassified Methylobacterium]